MSPAGRAPPCRVPLARVGGALLCSSPQIATTRKLTVHLRPPATCDLEISLQGIKLILTVNEYSQDEEVRVCRGEEGRGGEGAVGKGAGATSE